jgi:hypothetical protein
MKTFFFLISFTFCSLAFSQGNLQFNNVINYVINSQDVYSPYSFSGSITIPQGKVWKIESASIKSNGNPGWSFILDNYVLFTWTVQPGGVLNSYWPVPFPIWLPAGTYNYLSQYYNNPGSKATFPGASISIIEFNIVP